MNYQKKLIANYSIESKVKLGNSKLEYLIAGPETRKDGVK